MQTSPIKKVIIVGGGTAGWITAAMLGKYLGRVVEIELIESDSIGTVGVGEATIPQILRMNQLLGINEADMMAACGATFKLGIEFNNWGHVGESYLHAFGYSGVHFNALQFHHYWLRAKAEGLSSNFWDYSPNTICAHQNKFKHITEGQNGLSGLLYAYHFDAGLYAQYLRRFAEKLGVKRTEGKIVDVNLDPDSGHIASVKMEGRDTIDGELFIDCSGFRGLLIQKALGVKYQDWSQWLPCNRAVTVACDRVEPLLPYTKATAHGAGWQWRIPLQHRLGNGHVYCSDYMDAEAAETILVNNLDGETIGNPKHIKFTTGRVEKFWHKNCVAIGLSGGFMEPLESTSIHLIQNHAGKLIDLFPQWPVSAAIIDEYNRQTVGEYDLIRDFLILHYKQTNREDTPFWAYCKNMDVPDTLKDKIELFRQSAKLRSDKEDLFAESSWVQVLMGQGLIPENYHSRANAMSSEQLEQFLGRIRSMIDAQMGTIPSQSEYIARYCPAQL